MMPTGPCPARVMVVGEAPGNEEERLGAPFVGTAGKELDKMLGEVGLARAQCFTTDVCRTRPPGNDILKWMPDKKKDILPSFVVHRDRFVHPAIVAGAKLLEKEIELCKPEVIIALGNLPLWVLTGRSGIKNWRGSLLQTEGGIPLIPTYHPSAILRQWAWRAIAVMDLRRAAGILKGIPQEPERRFITRPSYEQVISTLYTLRSKSGPLDISLDIETNYGHIICIGLSWTLHDAICIPFTHDGGQHYWSEVDEASIVLGLSQLLTQKNVQVIWQNGLYDAQYVYRSWHFIPRHSFDSMIGHHSCFSTLPKGLDFLSSMYCKFHVQWKGIARGLNRDRGVKKDD